MTNPPHYPIVQLEQFSYINDYKNYKNLNDYRNNYNLQSPGRWDPFDGQFHVNRNHRPSGGRIGEIQPLWIDEDTIDEDTIDEDDTVAMASRAYTMAARLREERLRERSSQPKPKTTVHFTTSCSICLEDFGNEKIASTECGHLFHSGCLEKALAIKKECPNCRTDL
jgi:hypothetical protein